MSSVPHSSRKNPGSFWATYTDHYHSIYSQDRAEYYIAHPPSTLSTPREEFRTHRASGRRAGNVDLFRLRCVSFPRGGTFRLTPRSRARAGVDTVPHLTAPFPVRARSCPRIIGDGTPAALAAWIARAARRRSERGPLARRRFWSGARTLVVSLRSRVLELFAC